MNQSEQFKKLVYTLSLLPDEELTPRIIESLGIQNALTQSELQTYEIAYQELCLPITGNHPSPTAPPEPLFIRDIIDSLPHIHNVVYHKICVELNYCELKKKGTDIADIGGPLAEALANIYDVKTFGTISGTWIASKNILDKLCECKK
ncbi:MAG: hypothetical protein R3E57_07370 [Porticoccaceae bacterium]